jgi:hypothetical protein
MWYETLNEGWSEFFIRKLVDEENFVDLGSMFAACDVSSLLENGKLHEARQKTLSYLHKLLTDKEIKIGQYWGGDGIADEYLGTPDEIIGQIRTEWNNTKEGVVNENPLAYEMSIHIVLKENPWPVWR